MLGYRRIVLLLAFLGVLALCGQGSAWLSSQATATPVAQAAKAPETAAQCRQRYKPHSKARAACIKRVNSEKPGSSCAHPIKAGVDFDHEPPTGVGVEIVSHTVQFPPNDEGTPPPGWADFVMGSVAGQPHTNISYATVGWTIDTSVVALCRAILRAAIPGYYHVHDIPLPNRTEASYNIEMVGGYTYALTLFDRYVR